MTPAQIATCRRSLDRLRQLADRAPGTGPDHRQAEVDAANLRAALHALETALAPTPPAAPDHAD